MVQLHASEPYQSDTLTDTAVGGFEDSPLPTGAGTQKQHAKNLD